jgi:LmbE family N-acetylglucosaminyl deacetylase
MKFNRLLVSAAIFAFILSFPESFSSGITKESVPGLTLMCLSAHPDDEDGATLAYYAKLRGVKTYSVFYTRGEGGQNETGSELYGELGAVRTRETLEAARILGSEVYFLGFPDFGFSKTAKETFEKWGSLDTVLARVVYVIRSLKPDVIITNHDTILTLPNRQHGNHQAVGITAYLAIEEAADSDYHPEMINEGLPPWQVKKLFFRNFGRIPVGKDSIVSVDVTKKVPSGQTIEEIALSALAKHRSQGMDKISLSAFPSAFRKHEYFLVRSDTTYPFDPTDLFSGIAPTPRTIHALPETKPDLPRQFSMRVSPEYSAVQLTDRNSNEKIPRPHSFTVQFNDSLDKTLDVVLTAKLDSSRLLKKEFSIAPDKENAYTVELSLPASFDTTSKTLRFTAVPSSPEGWPILDSLTATADVTLLPMNPVFSSKAMVGLIETYDHTTRETMTTFGVPFTLLDSAAIAFGDLKRYTAIILDLRAYEYRFDAVRYNKRLLDYAYNGGNLICFYHKTNDWNGKSYAPYPITITSERVTQEVADITVLEPENILLTTPNLIDTTTEWSDWVQERSIYLPSEDTTKTSARYERVLAMSDEDEHQPSTSLLWARYGKGTYTYTSLALYRQLRILQIGAVKLFLNMISQPAR